MTPKFKKFPAYGKKIHEERMIGLVPTNSVVVAFDWEIGKVLPRIAVVDEVPAESLELRFLAGLDVIIAYKEKHSYRVLDMVRAILKVNPRILQAFNVDNQESLIIKHSIHGVML